MKKFYHYLCIIGFSVLAFNTYAKTESEKGIENTDNSLVIDRITNDDIVVSVPFMVFNFNDTKIKLKFKNPEHTKLLLNNSKLHFIINGEDTELAFTNGEASFTHKFDDGKLLSIYIEEFSYNQNVIVCSLWMIILPIGLLLIWAIRRMMKKRKSSPTI